MWFSCFRVLPGSTEAQVTSGGIVKRLLIAYFIGNISAKKYQNPLMWFKVIASQRWDVSETRCSLLCVCLFVMAALWNRQAIIFSSCGFFYLSYSFFFFLLLSFFLAYSEPSYIGCLPYFHTWCGLEANLACRSEMCCTRLAENIPRKKSPKNSPAGHHGTTLSGCIFATKACIDNRKNC